MKIRINPDKGTFKVRFTLGDAVNVGLALATVKIVYGVAESMYIVSLRRLSPKLTDLTKTVRAKKEEFEAQKEQS